MVKKRFVGAFICIVLVLSLFSCGEGDEGKENSNTSSVPEVYGYDFVYKILANEGEAFDDLELERLFNILLARLDYLGYDGSNVTLYTGESQTEHFVKLEVPYNCDKETVDKAISRKGLFEVRDSDGNVIVDSSDAVDSYPELVELEDGSLEFAARIFYNEDGSVKLGQATEKISAYEDGRNQLEYYFDGVFVGNSPCESVISDGMVVVTRKGISEEEVLELTSFINIGMLNYELVLESAEKRA